MPSPSTPSLLPPNMRDPLIIGAGASDRTRWPPRLRRVRDFLGCNRVAAHEPPGATRALPTDGSASSLPRPKLGINILVFASVRGRNCLVLQRKKFTTASPAPLETRGPLGELSRLASRASGNGQRKSQACKGLWERKTTSAVELATGPNDAVHRTTPAIFHGTALARPTVHRTGLADDYVQSVS
jgi:hypothetical protein